MPPQIQPRSSLFCVIRFHLKIPLVEVGMKQRLDLAVEKCGEFQC